MSQAPSVMAGKEDEQLRESVQGTRPGRAKHPKVSELAMCSNQELNRIF